MYSAQVAEFLDAIGEGRQPRPSGEDGRVVMQVVEDAYRSAGLPLVSGATMAATQRPINGADRGARHHLVPHPKIAVGDDIGIERLLAQGHRVEPVGVEPRPPWRSR